MSEDLEEKLATLPLFANIDRSQITAERLGGLTNLNYRVKTPNDHYVLRLAGPGTGDYIKRDAEKHNAQVAAEAGVNAEVLHFDASDGSMVTRYVEESVTMSIESFRDLGAVRRAALAFRRLHDCGSLFQGQFELFSQIDMYLSVLQKLGCPIPDDYESVKQEAQAARAALTQWSLPNVPCHCDPLYENFLDTGKRMYIIDFEYAGNTDPMWDLGDLSVEAEFTPEQDRQLMEAYFGRPPDPFESGRMVMYKALCDLLWTLWGVVQHANDNPADDFWTYSVNRLARCKALMNSPDFASHLAAVKRGPVT